MQTKNLQHLKNREAAPSLKSNLTLVNERDGDFDRFQQKYGTDPDEERFYKEMVRAIKQDQLNYQKQKLRQLHNSQGGNSPQNPGHPTK